MKGGPVKLCRFVKPTPSVSTANTVPLPELPPDAVPYRVLPDRISPADGPAPSLKLKLCRVLKPVPLVLRAKHRAVIAQTAALSRCPIQGVAG